MAGDSLESRIVIEVKEIGEGVAAGSGGGKGGGLLGGLNLGGLGALIAPLAKVAAIGAIIAEGFGSTIGMLGRIINVVGMILRPLDMMLTTALMPILYVLQPIGTFFNTIMRPYLLKSQTAMATGGQLLKQGDVAGSLEAFGLGAQYLLQPFFDLSIKAVTFLGSIFADVANVMTGGVFSGAFETLKSQLTTTGEVMTRFSADILDQQLGRLLAKSSETSGTKISGLVTALDKMGTPTDTLKSSFINTLAEMGKLGTYLDGGDSFADKLKTWMDKLDTKARDMLDELDRKNSSATSIVNRITELHGSKAGREAAVAIMQGDMKKVGRMMESDWRG